MQNKLSIPEVFNMIFLLIIFMLMIHISYLHEEIETRRYNNLYEALGNEKIDIECYNECKVETLFDSTYICYHKCETYEK